MVRALIAGIDPGTTVGYAFLDLNGKLLTIGSGRALALNKIVSTATIYGKPIAIGTDKAKPPGFIEAFASKFRARVFHPEEDLKEEEKRNLVKHLSEVNPGVKWENEHEFDALSCAGFAFSNLKNLLERIRKSIREHSLEKEHDLEEHRLHFDRVAELVLKQGIAIKSAIALVEEKEPELKPVLQAVEEERMLSPKSVAKLYSELAMARREIELLKLQNKELRVEKTSDGKSFFYKERLLKLVKNLNKARFERDKALQELHELARLASRKELIALKELINLGWQEIKNCQTKFGIEPGELLFVHKPSEMSQRAIEQLKKKEVTIVTFLPPPSSLRKELLVVQLKPCRFLRAGGLIFIPSQRLQRINVGKGLIERVIKTYKKSRAG